MGVLGIAAPTQRMLNSRLHTPHSPLASPQPARFHTLSPATGPVGPVMPDFPSFRFITAVDATSERAIGDRRSAFSQNNSGLAKCR
jgi:hypothetical protein